MSLAEACHEWGSLAGDYRSFASLFKETSSRLDFPYSSSRDYLITFDNIYLYFSNQTSFTWIYMNPGIDNRLTFSRIEFLFLKREASRSHFRIEILCIQQCTKSKFRVDVKSRSAKVERTLRDKRMNVEISRIRSKSYHSTRDRRSEWEQTDRCRYRLEVYQVLQSL
jgi:hypothetical protein